MLMATRHGRRFVFDENIVEIMNTYKSSTHLFREYAIDFSKFN